MVKFSRAMPPIPPSMQVVAMCNNIITKTVNQLQLVVGELTNLSV